MTSLFPDFRLNPFLCLHLTKMHNIRLARWGDGEWSVVLGHTGENCDGNNFFPDMTEEFRKIILSDIPYLFATHSGKKLKNEMEEFLSGFDELPKQFYNKIDTEIFHRCFKEGVQYDLYHSLMSESHLLVGPKYLEKLKPDDHIITPDQDSWLLKNSLMENIKSRAKDGVNIYLCCGLTSVWLVHKLHEAQVNASVIDVGSLFDPFAGKLSRSFHRKYHPS